jgi:hypothetical protein
LWGSGFGLVVGALGSLALIRQELGPRFVGLGVARQKVRLEGRSARPLGSLLAVSLCLAAGLLLVTAGTALGISGFASPGPAVRAQYPDATGPQGPGPLISSLGSVMRVTRDIDRDQDPKVAARRRAIEQEDTRKAKSAVLSASVVGDARQSGSIALLLAGIAVLSVGGVLRWRRDL